jgi:excisionase family DNA binding protein
MSINTEQPDNTTLPVPVLLVTVKQAAHALQTSEKTVWNLMERGKLPFLHIFGARRIRTDDLHRLATKGTTA